VRIFGEEYQVRAQVASIEGYSAHADQRGLLEWADNFDRSQLQQIFLVHGEPEEMGVLADKLRDIHEAPVSMPTRGEQFDF
jgi:metallo-beta-lactamase family protein